MKLFKRSQAIPSLPKTEIHLAKEEVILFSQRAGSVEGFFSHRSLSKILREWVHLLEEHCQFHRASPSDLRWVLAAISRDLQKLETHIHQSGGKVLQTYIRDRESKLLVNPESGEVKFLDPALTDVSSSKSET